MSNQPHEASLIYAVGRVHQFVRREMGGSPRALALAKLERRQLVTRTLDPGHGRVLRTTPTEAGLALLTSADPAVAAIQDEVLAGVPCGQRAALQDGMRAAMAHVSTAPADDEG